MKDEQVYAKILADSTTRQNVRLTTFEVRMPRCILAEFNTHRVFGRNSASSRAIPVNKQISRMREDMFVPNFAKNQKGMQSFSQLEEEQIAECLTIWEAAGEFMGSSAERLAKMEAHKQFVNRLLEPFSFHTVVVTATEWSNFFAQRVHKDAEPHMQIVATKMFEAYQESIPQRLLATDWHRPLIFPEDLAPCREIATRLTDPGYVTSYDFVLNAISAARCARVSYLTHDGKRDVVEDYRMFLKLVDRFPGHWSPLEHVATVARPEEMSYMINQLTLDVDKNIVPKLGQIGFCGHLKGWKCLRKFYDGENISHIPNHCFEMLEARTA